MNICQKCTWWVDCHNKGFCLQEDLFTYTEKESCRDFEQGKPMTEEEYEEENKKWLRNLMKKSTSREG